MDRRSFLKQTGAGLAAGAVAAPAIAQSTPAVRWRLVSSFPKSLDALFGPAVMLANRVSVLTDGKFQIQTFGPGEIVPALSVLDAVKDGTVQCGHSASYYYVGKDKTFAFDTALPFGLTSRQQNAWMYYGGGLPLMREFFRDYNIINFVCGNTGAQMGGWFRKEIKSLADVKGLKMRIPGIGGEIWARLGAVPQAIPPGDIYPALEKGAIDAVEFVGPYDDEKLGFYKVAKHYYYPGWWEGCAQGAMYVNVKEWEALPKAYQEAFEVATVEANALGLANYDAKNPAALLRLVQNGAQLHPFPADFMKAAYKAALEYYDEEAAKNPAFKKIYEPWKKFRAEQYQWFKVAEASFQNFVFNAR